MNAERLHAVLRDVQQDINSTNLVSLFQQLINALQNVVNQPQASHQQNLANTLQKLYEVLSESKVNEFTPSWQKILEEIGALDLLGNNLKTRIENIFQRNQITPAVALQELKEMRDRLQRLKVSVDQAVSAFAFFEIGYEELEPGDCEVGFIIPRTAIENRFDKLADELKELNFVINTISEITTGQREIFEVRTLSSSDLMIYLKSLPVIGACTVFIVDKLLDWYLKVLQARRIRAEIDSMNMPRSILTEIERWIEKEARSVIKEIGKKVFESYYKANDEHRKKELENALEIALIKILKRIDKGYSIDVRTGPIPPSEESNEEKEEELPVDSEIQHLTTIQELSKKIKFIALEGEPILSLPESDSGDTQENENK